MIKIIEFLADGSARELSDKEVHEYGRNLNPYVDPRFASIKKDATVPNVGDVVRLNDGGVGADLRQKDGSCAHEDPGDADHRRR